MDTSKLPKFSQTPPPAPQPEQPPRQPIDYHPPPPYRPIGSGAEAALSIAIGVILLLAFPRFLQFLVTAIGGHPFRPFVDPSVEYIGTALFFSDLVLTAFAVALLVEGLVVLLAAGKFFNGAAFILMLLAALGNLLVAAANFPPLQIIHAVAVVFGGYIAYQQYHRLFAPASHWAPPTA